MQRKKARTKLAKLFRKIGIEFEDTYKIAKQILKEGMLVSDPCIKIEIEYEQYQCCPNHGPSLSVKGYKGPSGVVLNDSIWAILSKTR